MTVVFTFHLHGRQYADVNESMLDSLGWSKKDLERVAFRNLLTLQPRIFPMKDFPGIGDIDGKTIVVTDQSSTFGSSLILRPDICQNVAHRLDGDFWIIPMSFRECFCEPGSEDGNVLLEGFRKTQETLVPPSERATDQILFYDSGEKVIRVFG